MNVGNGAGKSREGRDFKVNRNNLREGASSLLLSLLGRSPDFAEPVRV